MSKDPGNLKIGEVFQEPYECEAIAWTIPHVSSLEITKSTEIRSPRFSYKNATWILKIFPCGGCSLGGKPGIITKMERLQSEIRAHNFSCRALFKYHNAAASRADYKFVEFATYQKENVIPLTGMWGMNWNSVLYHYGNYRWKDTITLVVEILSKKDSKTKSTEVNLGPVFAKNADSSKSIGELFIESFDVNRIAWKIPNMHSISVEPDNNVQSPAFSFAGASFILKLFLCGQTKFNSKNVDVVIERLHSHIENQTILYNIFFKSSIENETLMKDSYSNIPYDLVTGSFNSDHVQENIFEIMSYTKCLSYGHSSRPFATVVLMCEFRIPKETEIGLNSQKESLELFKDWTSLMTENIGKPEIGKITKKSFECDVISWTIPSFLLLLDAEGNSVGSPQFSYKGAIWIFEIYPHGRNYPNRKSSMQIVMKILYSQFAMHNVLCRMFFEDRDGREFSYSSGSFIFDSSHGERNSFHGDIFTLYNLCRHHGALKLVCEFYNQKNFVSEVDFKAKSFEEDLSNINTVSGDFSKSVGDILIKSFDVEIIIWKIFKARSLPKEVDYGVQSPSFTFAGASWIFKMFPFGRKKFESEKSVDVVIERMFSLLPKNPVSYSISFETYDKQIDEKGYSLEDIVKGLRLDRSGSFIFESNFGPENVCSVHSYADFFDLVAPNKASDTVFLVCDFRIETNAGVKMNIQTKPAKSSAESFGSVSEQKPVPVGFTFGGSSEKKSEQNTASSVSSCKASFGSLLMGQKPFPVDFTFGESFGSVSKRNPVPGGFTFGESSGSGSGQKPVPLGFTFGESSGSGSWQKPVPVGFSFGESSGSESGQKPAPLGFTFGAPVGSLSGLKPVPIVFTFGGSSEKKSEQNTAASVSSSKESTAKKCEQKLIPFGFTFKGSDAIPRESIDLPNKKLLQDLKELFLKQEDCDVVLNVKGQEFVAHRLILKARSSVFASTFRNDMKEKATGVVDIEDCDPSSFSDFLYFLYCGSIEKLSSENVFSLFTTADKYDVQDLRSECLKFMKKNLSVDTFCDTIAFALQHSERELIELATDFFSKNLQKIILTVKWQSFLVKNPIQGNELLIKALAPNK